MIAIQAGCILTPTETVTPGIVLIDDTKIVAVGPPAEVPIPEGVTLIDASDNTVVPGFIDTHTHGRDGHYFGQDVETTTGLCRSVVSTGVTGLLPTLASLLPIQYTLEMILDSVRVVRQAMSQDTGGAEILGVHMEGPYLSSTDTARGSQLVSNMRPPSIEELHRMVDASEGTIRKMCIAPELDGAIDVVRAMRELNIVPCAGHSTATYEQAQQAVQAGLSCATHVYNGMLPLHHRNPGLLGAVLNNDEVNAELIADGQHVSAAAIQILLRCKGIDGLHLITDNTIWAGRDNGVYQDGDRIVVVEEQRAYVMGGTLVGSVAPMNLCVANMVHNVGCSLSQAVQMVSLNPARVIGVSDRKGSLEPGKDADLVILEDDVQVHRVIVRGRQVYGSE